MAQLAGVLGISPFFLRTLHVAWRALNKLIIQRKKKFDQI